MESLPETYEMIEENTTIYDSIKNSPIGMVIKKECLPSERYDADLLKGEYIKTDLPQEDYVDVLLTIEANANISEQDIAIGDYIIKVGEQVFVKGKGYASSGYIVSIER